jgi:predicted alpha-1,6-mannanase (GH76 family)
MWERNANLSWILHPEFYDIPLWVALGKKAVAQKVSGS